MQEFGNLIKLPNKNFLGKGFKILNFRELNFNINNILLENKIIYQNKIKKNRDFQLYDKLFPFKTNIQNKNSFRFLSNYCKNEEINSLTDYIHKIDSKSNDELEYIEKILKSLIKNSNNALFSNLYYNNKDYFYKNGFDISKLNINFVKTAYIFEKKNIIDYIDFDSINDYDFKSLFKELITIDIANPELLNIILLKRPNIVDNFPTIIKQKDIVRELQGNNQTKFIQREVLYSKKFKIKCIYDTYYTNLKNDKKNRLLYRVKYIDDNTKEIIYYKRDEKNILAVIRIENNELKFLNIGTYEEKEIDAILNDSYLNMNEFDEKLSILSYALLKNKKNIIIKTNCKSIEDIVDNIKENNSLEKKDKIFICDFSIDCHNVQIVINNKNVIILNTGADFNYIKDKIKDEYQQENLDVKVRHIKTIKQSAENCVEASKLYTVIFFKDHDDPIKFLDMLNNFGEFQNKVLRCKKCENKIKCMKNVKNKDKFNKFKQSLNFISEKNSQLLKKPKHFSNVSENFSEIKKMAYLEKSNKEKLEYNNMLENTVLCINDLDNIIKNDKIFVKID